MTSSEPCSLRERITHMRQDLRRDSRAHRVRRFFAPTRDAAVAMLLEGLFALLLSLIEKFDAGMLAPKPAAEAISGAGQEMAEVAAASTQARCAGDPSPASDGAPRAGARRLSPADSRSVSSSASSAEQTAAPVLAQAAELPLAAPLAFRWPVPVARDALVGAFAGPLGWRPQLE